MTTIDREDLRDAAEGHLRFGGGGDDLANGVLALLRALEQAEAERNRLAAKLTHRSATVNRLITEKREAEARVQAVRQVLDKARDEFEQLEEAAIRRALEDSHPAA